MGIGTLVGLLRCGNRRRNRVGNERCNDRVGEDVFRERHAYRCLLCIGLEIRRKRPAIDALCWQPPERPMFYLACEIELAWLLGRPG